MNLQTTPPAVETSFSLRSVLHRFFSPRSKRTIRHFDSVPLSRLMSAGERELLATEKFSAIRIASLPLGVVRALVSLRLHKGIITHPLVPNGAKSRQAFRLSPLHPALRNKRELRSAYGESSFTEIASVASVKRNIMDTPHVRLFARSLLSSFVLRTFPPLWRHHPSRFDTVRCKMWFISYSRERTRRIEFALACPSFFSSRRNKSIDIKY